MLASRTVSKSPINDATAHMKTPSGTGGFSIHSRKTRARRRGARTHGAADSEEEIEREDLSDSASSSSASGSDTEESDLGSHEDTHRSPSRREAQATSESHQPPKPALRISGVDWSEMVTEEDANGAQGLPVVDFTDLARHASRRSSNTSTGSIKPHGIQLQRETEPPPIETRGDQEQLHSYGHTPRGHSINRPSTQNARQVYQQRLETDPSFVPTVGNFWGHDDRLLNQELRSLSGWWRGRWQNGNPRGSFGRGRGGGGFVGRGFESGAARDGSMKAEELPPIERTWGHDGFEEMSKEEQKSLHSRRAFPNGRRRGRNTPLQSDSNVGHPSNPISSRALRGSRPQASTLDRPWYSAKPEQIWTKQHDIHLHPALPRSGAGVNIRVKLPGLGAQTSRMMFTPPSHPHPRIRISHSTNELFVVRLPGKVNIENGLPPNHSPGQTIGFCKPSLDDSAAALPGSTHSTSSSAPSSQPSVPPDPSPNPVSPLGALNEGTFDPPQPSVWPILEVELPSAATVLPQLQTSFSPAQPSPAYASSYNYLPPSIPIRQHNLSFEAGQPLYLHHHTPPPVMYTPPPHSGHLHGPSSLSYAHQGSLSGEYPPLEFADPIATMPIFTPPRQSSRIEIRAPPGRTSPENKPTQRASTLRGSVQPFKPSHRTEASVAYIRQQQLEEESLLVSNYSAELWNEHAQETHGSQPQAMDATMTYYPQQHPYFYVDQYGYYPDVAQGQVQYDAYSTPQQVLHPLYY